MAKSKRLTAKEQREQFLKDTPSTYRTLLNMYAKNPAGLSRATLTKLQLAQSELKGRKRLNESEYEKYKNLYNEIKNERYKSGKEEWERKKKQSERKLIERRAEKLAGKGATKALEKYEKTYREEIKAEIENIYDRQYAQTVSNYSTEDKQEILRRMLGIGSRGVTLSDGSTFTVEDFNKILDRHGISLDRFTDKEDITKERYKQVKYTEWKTSISNEINQLLNLKDLTDREREGLRKMFKIYGT